VREQCGELQARRNFFERRDTQWHAQAGDIHVTLEEGVAFERRAGGMTTAADGAEVDYFRERHSRMLIFSQPARQRVSGIDLADAGIQKPQTGAFEDALAFQRERHDQQRIGKCDRHYP
jgi:hypothetical protein